MLGRDKTEPPRVSLCMGSYSHYLPRPQCNRLSSHLPTTAAVPSSQVHPLRSASNGPCFLPGEALNAAWAGALCRSRTGHEAKSAPGTSTRTLAASVNSLWLICRLRGCLPSGRPQRAGDWEGLRDAALELEGLLASICSSSWQHRRTGKPRVERPAEAV